MASLRLLLYFIPLVYYVEAAFCPYGTVFNTSFNRCYMVVTFPRTFEAAKDFCRSRDMYLNENRKAADRSYMNELARIELGRHYQYWVKREAPRYTSQPECLSVMAKYSFRTPCNDYLPFVCSKNLPLREEDDYTREKSEHNSSTTDQSITISESINYEFDDSASNYENDTESDVEQNTTVIVHYECNDSWKLLPGSEWCYQAHRLREGQSSAAAEVTCQSAGAVLLVNSTEEETKFIDTLVVTDPEPERSDASMTVKKTQGRKRRSQPDLTKCVFSQQTNGVFVPPLHDVNCFSVEKYFYCKMIANQA